MNAQVIGSRANRQIETMIAGIFRLTVGLATPVIIFGPSASLLKGWNDDQGYVLIAMLVALFIAVIIIIPLVLSGLISMVIGVVLLTAPEKGRRAALIFDAIFVISASLWLITSTVRSCTPAAYLIQPHVLLPNLARYAITLAYAAEAALLLRAWRLFAVLAGVFVMFALIVPTVNRTVHVRHIRPLLEYINANWVAVPKDASVWIETQPISPSSHGDTVSFMSNQGYWRICGVHGPGGWRFPTSTNEPAASMTWHQPLASLINSESTAQTHIANAGIVVNKTNKSQALKSAGGEVQYAIHSPAVRGTYMVDAVGNVSLYLWAPIIVPGHR